MNFYIPTDPFQAMQQQTQINNAYSGYAQSCERLATTNEKINDIQLIDAISNHLRSTPIQPLPDGIEPEFPLPSSLPQQVQELVDVVSRFKGVYPPMVFAALLGAIFCAAQGKFWLQISDHHRELLTGYILISSPSGSRKTAISQVLRGVFERQEVAMKRDVATVTPTPMEHKILIKVLQRMEKTVQDDVMDRIQAGESATDLLSSIKQDSERLSEFQQRFGLDDSLPRLLVKNLTLEAFAEEMVRQREFLGLWDDEGGFWKRSVQARSDDILLHGYTGEAFSYATKTAGTQHIDSPCAAILSFVQPTILRSLYGKDSLTEDGLLARVLPILCPSHRQNPSDISDKYFLESVSWYDSVILSLLKICTGRVGRLTINFSPDARDLHRQFEGDATKLLNGKNISPGLGGFISKAAGHAARIAGVLHLLQHSTKPHCTEVSASTMKMGIECANAFLRHAEIAFTPPSRDILENAKKIIDYVKKTCKTKCTSRELQRAISRKEFEVSPALLFLEQRGYLLRHYGRGGAMTCVFNPSLFQPQPLMVTNLQSILAATPPV